MRFFYRAAFFLVGCAILLMAGANARAQGTAFADTIPEFYRLMQQTPPNVQRVTAAYDAYRRQNPGVKTLYTKLYRKWMMRVRNQTDEDGTVRERTPAERDQQERTTRFLRTETPQARKTASRWQPLGPYETYNRRNYIHADPQPVSWHSNVYCLDVSKTNPNTIYIGGESGGAYKSVDRGQTWRLISESLPVSTVFQIKVHPQNENIVIFSADSPRNRKSYRSDNGGVTWREMGLENVIDLAFHPQNSNVVFACTRNGFSKTTDGGSTWRQIQSGYFTSVALKPFDPSVVYAIGVDRANEANLIRFYKSTNGGDSFSVKDGGWFSATPAERAAIKELAGVLAVTEADPNRVYALLVTEDKPDVPVKYQGFIGVYASTNAGESWSLPHGRIGVPYDGSSHPNIMAAGATGGYYQVGGQFNVVLEASQVDPNKLLIGGIRFWYSNDGGRTFSNALRDGSNYHVDFQAMKLVKTPSGGEEAWITCDGGVYYSTDYFQTRQARNKGIYGGTYWGFGQGIREDVTVGGRYHNGDAVGYDKYPNGVSLFIGGGEQATGYVNPGENRKVYFSDAGAFLLPEQMNQSVASVPVGEFPNESYARYESSTMAFDQRVYNTVYIGKDNQIKKSTDGGRTYATLRAFGGNPAEKVFWIEVSRLNSSLIYAHQKTGSGSILWRTRDGGSSWEPVNLPANRRDLLFTLSATDENELWLGFPHGASGQKVFKTSNAGASWTNLSTGKLDGSELTTLTHQAGTNGGVYATLFSGVILYRNATMADWDVYSDGFPAGAEPLRLIPFHQKGKVRIATWSHSIWEADLYETGKPVATISASRRVFDCVAGEKIVQFADCSARSGSASIRWDFPGGEPSSSTATYPTVRYARSGRYDVTLTVQDVTGTSTETLRGFIVVDPSVEIANARSEEAFCAGKTLTLNASVSQGYQIQWRRNGADIPGANGPAYTVTETGAYTVAARNGTCSATSPQTVNVRVAPNPQPNLSGTAEFCANDGGTLNAAVNGGVPPYAYAWKLNGAEVSTAAGSLRVTQPGSYSLDVRDANGCAGSTSAFSVRSNPNPTASAGGSVTLTGSQTHSLAGVTTASGGTPPYAYAWSTSPPVPGNGSNQANPTFGPFSQNTALSLAITDAKGCRATASANVSYANCPMTVRIEGQNSFCEGLSTPLRVFVGNGTPPYNHAWRNANGTLLSSSTQLNALQAGTYTVEITDALGCRAKSPEFPVTTYARPQVSIVGNPVFCTGGSTTLQAQVSNRDPGQLSYRWVRITVDRDTVVSVSSRVEANKPGNYTVMVSDAEGCRGESALTVSERAATVVARILPVGETTVYAPRTVTLNAATGLGYAYQWNIREEPVPLAPSVPLAGATTATHVASRSGWYTVTVSRDGCSVRSPEVRVEILIPTALNPTAEDGFMVRPNPTSGELIIEVTLKTAAPARLILHDLAGRRLLSFYEPRATISHRFAADVSKLADGVYFVSGEAGGYSFQKKVLKTN